VSSRPPLRGLDLGTWPSDAQSTVQTRWRRTCSGRSAQQSDELPSSHVGHGGSPRGLPQGQPATGRASRHGENL